MAVTRGDDGSQGTLFYDSEVSGLPGGSAPQGTQDVSEQDVVGGGLIYGIRLLGIGPLTTLAKTMLPDYDLTRGAGSAHSTDHKKILEDLAVDQSASQVPLAEVRKNPFRMSDVVGMIPEKPSGDPNAAGRATADRAKHEADQKKQALTAALNRARGNLTEAAAAVGLSRSKAYRMLRSVRGRTARSA